MWPNVSECQSLFLGLSRDSWEGGREIPELWDGQRAAEANAASFCHFLPSFEASFKQQPVTKCHHLVPIDSQLGVEDFSALCCCCKYLANCSKGCKPKQRLVLEYSQARASPGSCSGDLHALIHRYGDSPKSRVCTSALMFLSERKHALPQYNPPTPRSSSFA